MWNRRWESPIPFILIRKSKKDFALIFPDESSDMMSEMSNKIGELPFMGLHLRSWRQKKGISLAQMAELTGLQATNLAAMERGARAVGLKSLACISRAIKNVEKATDQNGSFSQVELADLFFSVYK